MNGPVVILLLATVVAVVVFVRRDAARGGEIPADRRYAPRPTPTTYDDYTPEDAA